MALSGCGSADPKPLELAQQHCDSGKVGTQVADDKKTLIIRAVDPTSTSLTVPELACILAELKTTSAVVSHIEMTSALDGRQEDHWGKYKAFWTYHSDRGLNLTIQENTEEA